MQENHPNVLVCKCSQANSGEHECACHMEWYLQQGLNSVFSIIRESLGI